MWNRNYCERVCVCVCVAVVENMFTILAETHNNNNKNVNKIEKKQQEIYINECGNVEAKQSRVSKNKKKTKKHFADNKAKLNCETWLMWCAVVRVHDIDTI